MFGQPGLQFAIDLDLFLQHFQRIQPGFEVGVFGLFGVGMQLRGLAGSIQQRCVFLQAVQCGLGLGGGIYRRLGLQAQFQQAVFVHHADGVVVLPQFFKPGLQLAALFFNATLLRRQHLDLLLHGGHAATLRIGLGLGRAQGIFQIGQLMALFFQLRLQHSGLGGTVVGLRTQTFNLLRSVGLAGGPLGDLLLERDKALLHAVAAFHHKADFGLQPPDFGAGLVQQTLGAVDLVARRVMGLAHGFQLAFHAAQVGSAPFQCVAAAFALQQHAGLFGLGFAAL